MSRKNHHAKRTQYQRTDVNRIMNDLKLEQAAQQEKVSEECGENRRYEFRRLPSDLLLSDTSYQRQWMRSGYERSWRSLIPGWSTQSR